MKKQYYKKNMSLFMALSMSVQSFMIDVNATTLSNNVSNEILANEEVVSTIKFSSFVNSKDVEVTKGVRVARNITKNFIKNLTATKNFKIEIGDTIVTDKDTIAFLEVDANVFFKMNTNTSVRVIQNENGKINLQVLSGDLYFKAFGEETFSIKTPHVELESFVPIDVDDPLLNDPTLHDPILDDPTLHDPILDDPALHDPILDDPALHDPILDDPALHDPILDDPALHDPILDDPLLNSTLQNNVVSKTMANNETMLINNFSDSDLVDLNSTAVMVDGVISVANGITKAWLFAGNLLCDVIETSNNTSKTEDAEKETSFIIEHSNYFSYIYEEITPPTLITKDCLSAFVIDEMLDILANFTNDVSINDSRQNLTTLFEITSLDNFLEFKESVETLRDQLIDDTITTKPNDEEVSNYNAYNNITDYYYSGDSSSGDSSSGDSSSGDSSSGDSSSGDSSSGDSYNPDPDPDPDPEPDPDLSEDFLVYNLTDLIEAFESGHTDIIIDETAIITLNSNLDLNVSTGIISKIMNMFTKTTTSTINLTNNGDIDLGAFNLTLNNINFKNLGTVYSDAQSRIMLTGISTFANGETISEDCVINTTVEISENSTVSEFVNYGIIETEDTSISNKGTLNKLVNHNIIDSVNGITIYNIGEILEITNNEGAILVSETGNVISNNADSNSDKIHSILNKGTITGIRSTIVNNATAVNGQLFAAEISNLHNYETGIIAADEGFAIFNLGDGTDTLNVNAKIGVDGSQTAVLTNEGEINSIYNDGAVYGYNGNQPSGNVAGRNASHITGEVEDELPESTEITTLEELKAAISNGATEIVISETANITLDSAVAFGNTLKAFTNNGTLELDNFDLSFNDINFTNKGFIYADTGIGKINLNGATTFVNGEVNNLEIGHITATINVNPTAVVDVMTNNSVIETEGVAINNDGTIDALENLGKITAGFSAVYNTEGKSIKRLKNYENATITSTGGNGVKVMTGASIGVYESETNIFENLGSIDSVYNDGNVFGYTGIKPTIVLGENASHITGADEPEVPELPESDEITTLDELKAAISNGETEIVISKNANITLDAAFEIASTVEKITNNGLISLEGYDLSVTDVEFVNLGEITSTNGTITLKGSSSFVNGSLITPVNSEDAKPTVNAKLNIPEGAAASNITNYGVLESSTVVVNNYGEINNLSNYGEIKGTLSAVYNAAGKSIKNLLNDSNGSITSTEGSGVKNESEATIGVENSESLKFTNLGIIDTIYNNGRVFGYNQEVQPTDGVTGENAIDITGVIDESDDIVVYNLADLVRASKGEYLTVTVDATADITLTEDLDFDFTAPEGNLLTKVVEFFTGSQEALIFTNNGIINLGSSNLNFNNVDFVNLGTIQEDSTQDSYRKRGRIYLDGVSTFINGDSAAHYDLTNENGTYPKINASVEIMETAEVSEFINHASIKALMDGVNNKGLIGELSNFGNIYGVDGTLSNYGIYNESGTINSLINNGTIYGADYSVYNRNVIDSFTNEKLISSPLEGIYNNGTINTLLSTGEINAGTAAVYNNADASISSFTNRGLINTTGSTSSSINNVGTITEFVTAGDITGTKYVIYNATTGIVDSFTNSGNLKTTASSSSTVYNIGEIQTFINDGDISVTGETSYCINNDGLINDLSNLKTITSNVKNGRGIYNNLGTINVLTNEGDITSSYSYSSSYSASNYGINNDGKVGELINKGNITSSSYYSYGINNSGEVAVLTNNGDITSSSSSSSSYGINNSGEVAVLTNNGDITSSSSSSSYSYGINNSGEVAVLTNNGDITSSSSYRSSYGISSNGEITNLTTALNSNIKAQYAIYNYDNGLIESLTNGGVITSTHYAIYNYRDAANLNPTINKLVNTGSIISSNSNSSYGKGIYNYNGLIETLTNEGDITTTEAAVHNYKTNTGYSSKIDVIENSGDITSSTSVAILNTNGELRVLINNGDIEGSSNGISNYSSKSSDYTPSITTLTNNGVIFGGTNGINNEGGTIEKITNEDEISGTTNGINNTGTISNLINSYLLYGGSIGILNDGTISTITNNLSAIIEAKNYAIKNDSLIDHILNNGTLIANDALYIGNQPTTVEGSNASQITGVSSMSLFDEIFNDPNVGAANSPENEYVDSSMGIEPDENAFDEPEFDEDVFNNPNVGLEDPNALDYEMGVDSETDAFDNPNVGFGDPNDLDSSMMVTPEGDPEGSDSSMMVTPEGDPEDSDSSMMVTPEGDQTGDTGNDNSGNTEINFEIMTVEISDKVELSLPIVTFNKFS